MAGRHARRVAHHKAVHRAHVAHHKAAHRVVSEATRKKIAAAEKGKHRGSHPRRKPKHG